MSRLKSMELQGYKTFANRTIFEFPESITSIVGPNGSGKSNVSDAIRWVLGEQSFSMLRARKTEDMIFAGSEQKTRAGMATATITFDNQDGWLPIDFTEVAITRRAYRDGQNEYYLNGQKIRLKDISELLSQAGMAERTYTIVGQGSVDSALSIKPEERRRFFEEAAGIGLYRSRREEAIQRMETTRRNLERLLDIVGELEPRMTSLEKQAKRALEYERIKADLQLLLREWYGYHWHKNQKELGHFRSVVEVQEKRFSQSKEKLKEVEAKLALKRTALGTLRSSLNEWHNQSSNYHREREIISKKLAVLDERQQSLVEQRKTIQSDITRIEEEQTARKEKLQDLYKDLERLKSDLKEAQEQGNLAKNNLKKRQIERDQVEGEVRNTRKLMLSAETKKVENQAKRNELNSRIENLKNTQGSLAQAVATAEQELIGSRTLLEKANKEQNDVETKRKIAQEKLNEKKDEARQLEAQQKTLQDELNKLETERSRAKAQLEILIQAEQTFSGINQGAKYILESAQQGKLTGQFRSLSSQIDVPHDIELAIASVLGEYLDGVLVNKKQDLENVLNFLEKGDKGRAVLIPEDFNADQQNLRQINDPDLLGIASELIEVNGQLKTTIKLLLGQVVVVKDRSAAQRIASQLPVYARAVTLKGEIFGGNGIVIAGKETRGGIIARPRQKKELQATFEQLEASYQEKNKENKEIRQLIENNKKQEISLEADLRQLTQNLQQCIQTAQKANLLVEQIKQRIEFQNKQLTGIEGQKNQSEEEIKKVNIELQNLNGKIEEFQTQIRNQNKALAGMPLEELQSQVVHWNTQQAVVGRAVNDGNNRLQEYENTIQQNEIQFQDMKTRLLKQTEQFVELENEKKQQVFQESESNLNIQQIGEKIDPAEKELNELEIELENIQAEQISAQQAVTVNERYISQAHLDVTRQREALDSLRRKIEDDFGLVTFQYSAELTSPIPLPLEGFVSDLPNILEITPEIEENVSRQRALLRRMGAVNLDAKTEYDSVKERFDFMTTQINDLKRADEDLQQIISELDVMMKTEFEKTFSRVAIEFKQIFTKLFGGGSAKLVLIDKDNPADSGVEIEARLPGRREQGLALLSGGERSLTAVALIFALLKVSPTPFCVLDEVDAALDEANVGRFCELLKDLSLNTQFIIITHNRNTVQASGVIYGVTMGKDSVSQVISLKLDEVSEDMVK